METEGEKMEYRTVEPQRDPKFLRLPDRESFDKIVARANDGEAEALSALHRLLDQHPQIWKQVGDLNRHAVTTLINMIADGNTLLQQAIAKSIEQLVSDLTETETPSMIEQLLISQVVCTWLECQLAISFLADLGGETLVRSRFHLKLQESSQRRFSSSVLALQHYRRREVEIARLKCKVVLDARKAKIGYEEKLAVDHPWLHSRP